MRSFQLSREPGEHLPEEKTGFPPGSASLVTTISNINASSWVDPTYNGWNMFYAITAVDSAGNESPAGYPGVTTDVGQSPLPDRWSLGQNVPNPFNPSTTISFTVPQGGGHVTLTVFDVVGRRVATLLDRRVNGGVRSVSWDGHDRSGGEVASGVYFYRLITPVGEFTRKMTLVE